MKERIYNILLSPFFIAFVITVIVILILPDYFPHYKIEQQSIQLNHNCAGFNCDLQTYYCDLDGDSTAERIDPITTSLGEAAIVVRRIDQNVINQWNLRGNFIEDERILTFRDIDGDGKKEILTLVSYHDSLLLDIIKPFANTNGYASYLIKPHLGFDGKLSDLDASKIFVVDLNKDGKKDLVFYLSGGYNAFERHVYALDLSSGVVLKSPFICNKILGLRISKWDEDGYPNILLSTYSTLNLVDSLAQYGTDSFDHFFVLNHNLKFLFPPIEIPAPFSGIHSFKFENQGNKRFLAFVESLNDDILKDQLQVYNQYGKLIKKVKLSKGLWQEMLFNRKNQIFYAYKLSDHTIYKFDFSLDILRTYHFPGANLFLQMDVDGKPGREILMISNFYKRLTIFRKDFTDPTAIDLPNIFNGNLFYGNTKINGKEVFYLGFKNKVITYQY